MRLYAGDIVTVKWPVQLLGSEGDDLISAFARPVESRLFQKFLSQARATAFPVEDLDALGPPVTNYKQMF